MKVEMLMPQMGESITEATISKWLKGVGDKVEKDETILEISTDKVDSEIPAPASGVIVEILFNQGDVVPVRSKIALIDTEGSSATTPPKSEEKASKVEANSVASPSKETSETSEARFYSPLVRSLADKHGLSDKELASISGSGQGGRLTKTDVLSYIEKRGEKDNSKAKPIEASNGAASSKGKVTSPSTEGPGSRAIKPIPEVAWGNNEVEVLPMDNMRVAIAEHMIRSKHTSAHVYSVQEVDMTAVSRWRQANKGKFEAQEGFKLSLTPFFLEAAVRGIQKFPMINCSVDGKNIILKKHVNLGCAVALGTTGLIVPVIKNAEEKNFVGLARSLNDLAARARNKKLLPDDVAGGTFTVTNPGVFGTIIGTPIINQPQVAILCLGAVVKRPVVIDDMIAIREMCYLTLSYDHRVIDGSLSGQFLAFIREYLEKWDSSRAL